MTNEQKVRYERSTKIVKPMESAVRDSIIYVVENHPNVTSAEIAKILSEEATAWIRYAIQDERERKEARK